MVVLVQVEAVVVVVVAVQAAEEVHTADVDKE